MVSRKFDSLGLAVMLAVPTTVEEFDQLAKKPGACLDEAINNVVYRGALADFRYYFCEELQSETGVERLHEVLKDDKGQPKLSDGEQVIKYTESEAKYVKRVLAEKKATIESFQPLADKVLAMVIETGEGDTKTSTPAVRFDPTASDRGPAKPKKTPKYALEVAEQIIAAGKEAGVAAKLSQMLGHPVAQDKESLAKAVHENELNKQREQQKQLTSATLALVS